MYLYDDIPCGEDVPEWIRPRRSVYKAGGQKLQDVAVHAHPLCLPSKDACCPTVGSAGSICCWCKRGVACEAYDD